MLVYLKVIY